MNKIIYICFSFLTKILKTMILIMGGGIAGLTMANLLQKSGIDFRVYEKAPLNNEKGHGFIIPNDGLKILSTIIDSDKLVDKGNFLTHFTAYNHEGIAIKTQQMNEDFVISRRDLVALLEENISITSIVHHKKVKDITISDKGIETILFCDGETINPPSLVLCCDGIYSTIRRKLMPEKKLEASRVQEIVTIFKSELLLKSLGHQFKKFKHQDGGLAFGIFKLNESEVLCYAQFDTHKHPLLDESIGGIVSFMQQHFGTWVTEETDFFNVLNFQNAHYWKVNELDPLDAYYYKNAVFVGDAAHSLLPFTSQGVCAAINDAHILTDCLLANENNYDKALQMYSDIRKLDIAIHKKNGSILRTEFLMPIHKQKNQSIPISVKS